MRVMITICPTTLTNNKGILCRTSTNQDTAPQSIKFRTFNLDYRIIPSNLGTSSTLNSLPQPLMALSKLTNTKTLSQMSSLARIKDPKAWTTRPK